MYLTRQSQTALSVLAACARKPGKYFTVKQLAHELGVTEDHLDTAATVLLRHALLVLNSDCQAGFRLAIDPEDVTLALVLRLTQPELYSSDLSDDGVGLVRNTNFQMLLNVASSHFIRLTEQYSIADLAVGGRADVLVPAGNLSLNTSTRTGMST